MPLTDAAYLPNFHHNQYCKDLSFYVPSLDRDDEYDGTIHGYHDWDFDRDDDMPGLE